mgnify:CR=1 FL=1
MKKPSSQAALVFLIALATLSLATTAFAQGDSISQVRASVAIDRAALASAQRATPADSLAAFLGQRGAAAETIDSIHETANFEDAAGRRFARFEQRIDGLRKVGNVKTAR